MDNFSPKQRRRVVLQQSGAELIWGDDLNRVDAGEGHATRRLRTRFVGNGLLHLRGLAKSGNTNTSVMSPSDRRRLIADLALELGRYPAPTRNVSGRTIRPPRHLRLANNSQRRCLRHRHLDPTSSSAKFGYTDATT